MDQERLREYRFRGIDQGARQEVWNEVAGYVHELMGRPERLLDPAAGHCEFLNGAPARERWAVDLVDYRDRRPAPGTKVIVADIMDADLPEAYFDGVWVSNFLEHLPDPGAVARFLSRMRECTRPGGRIAVMGPNFRFAHREYFDCADHTLALTDVSVAEHLYVAGFEPERVEPRFLPYSFRGRLPASRALARAYLRARPAWRLLGKQFLAIARRPAAGG